MVPDPYRGTFLGRLSRRFGRTDTNLLVQRERRIGNGLREDVVLRNPGAEPTTCTVTVAVEADFADLFEVKEGRVQPRGERGAQAQDDRLYLDLHWRGTHRGRSSRRPAAPSRRPLVSVRERGSIRYDALVPARGEWSTSLLVRPVVDGEAVEPSFPLDRPERETLPARRLQRWRETTPIATTGDDSLQRTLQRSQQDVGALRIFDPEDPTLAAVAAGAPWFMALFGRDSLLTAYMALPVDRSLALGTLRTLARHQGRTTDPATEEEPGRILHEVRLGVDSGLSLGGGSIYYGTVDATPLFVVLLGELARWGGASGARSRSCCRTPTGRWSGWSATATATGTGSSNTGGRPTAGCRTRAGRTPGTGSRSPTAAPPRRRSRSCEVQGYAYDAFRARAELARWLDDDAGARRWSERAAALKTAFNERFWLPERGWYAAGPGPGQEAGRLLRVQHGSLPVERHRRR